MNDRCSKKTVAARRLRQKIAPLALATHLAVAGMASTLIATRSAHAADTVASFDIPAGALNAAIHRFVAQSGVFVAADGALTEGRSSPGLQGKHAPADALERLLAGTELAAVRQGDGSFTLRKAAALKLQDTGRGEALLPVVRVKASAVGAGVQSASIGYAAGRSSSGARTEAKLADVPFSVQVVPEQLREDQAATTVRAAAENVSGVMAGPTSIHEDMLIRGFQVRDTYRNGIPTRRIGMTETSNVDSVSVIKGPSGVMFGRGEVGGAVNVETKRPLGQSHASVQQRVGSNDLSESSADVGGLLGDTLWYRVNGLYRDASSFRDGVRGQRTFVAPSATWKPRDGVQLNLDIEAFTDTSPNDKGQIAIGNRPADVPRERNFSGTAAHRRTGGELVALDGQVKVSEAWTLKGAVFHERSRERGLEYVQGRDPSLGLSENILLRIPREVSKRDIESTFGKLEAWGVVSAGGVRNELVLGIDRNHSAGTFHFNDGDLSLGEFDQIDVLQPTSNPSLTTGADQLRVRNTTRWTGLYIQDRIDFNERFAVLLGLRRDAAQTATLNQKTDVTDGTHDRALSPRVGMTLRVTPEWRAFAQATRSIGFANDGVNASGRAFAPETGQQFEIGAKYENLRGDLAASVSIYDLTKRNVLVSDTANPGFSTQSGKVGARGLEFDLSGRLEPNLNLLLAYTLMRSETLVSTNADELGKRTYGVPLHSGRIFLRYDLAAGGGRGWSFGGGLYAVSTQQGDNANSFQVPGYGRWDAFAVYRLPAASGTYNFQLNIQNLTDRTYYTPSGSRDNIGVGAPRMVVATLKVEF